MKRITIRDLLGLLDYDRTGIRDVRIYDDDTQASDTLKTDSYLLEFIEDVPVNCIDVANGLLIIHVSYVRGGECGA